MYPTVSFVYPNVFWEMYGIRVEYVEYGVSQCIPAEIGGPSRIRSEYAEYAQNTVSYEIHAEYIRIHQDTKKIENPPIFERKPPLTPGSRGAIELLGPFGLCVLSVEASVVTPGGLERRKPWSVSCVCG